MNHIYALSALRTLTAGLKEPAEPLLTRNESPALILVIKDALAAWIMKAAHWITDFDIDQDDILTVTMTRAADSEAADTAFRREIERMLAFRAMAMALPACEADDYEATADSISAGLIRTLAGAGHSGRITPHWL